MRTVCILATLLFTSTGFGQESGWYPSYADARTVAEKDGLPILIHFHAWYCAPCKRMDREVFSDGDVQRALGDGIVSVQVDTTHDPDLAARFDATTVPRDVVVFPDGSVETLNIGYMPRGSYANLIRETALRARRMQKEDSGNKIRPDSINPDSAVISTISEPEIDPPIIGLEGFCPVTLGDRREWIPGKSSITADYRGIRYQFATDTDRDIFLKNPASYAPQDLGCDPVVLTTDQKALTGSIRFGAFFDNHLYLFRSDENREEFRKQPLRYTTIRSALRVNQIEGTSFQ